MTEEVGQSSVVSDTSIYSSPESFHEALAKVGVEETVTPEAAPIDVLEQNEGNEKEEDVPVDLEDHEEPEETPKGKMVPIGRLSKESQRRKDLEGKLQEERDNRIRIEHELAQMRNSMNEFFGSEKKQEAQFDPIDPEAKEYVDKELGKLKQQNDALAQSQATMYYAQQLREHQEIFTQKHEDFNDAYRYLEKAKLQEFLKTGLSEDQARNEWQQWVGTSAARAFHSGRNVAEVAYDLAQHLGYNPKSKGKASPKPLPNLDAIEKNMAKSESVTSMQAASGGGMGFLGSEGFKTLLSNNGTTDPKKFAEALKRINSSNGNM